MRYDTSIYDLLARASDEILERTIALREMKENQEQTDAFGFPTTDYARQERTRYASEMYLAIQNMQSIYADLEVMLPKISLLTSYVKRSAPDEAINMLFEELVDE